MSIWPRRNMTSWSLRGHSVLLLSDMTGFGSAPLFAQVSPGLNLPTMLAIFFCRSTRSARIRAVTTMSLSTGFTVVYEVALTVTGTPLTVLLLATGPTASWASACDASPARRNPASNSVLMPHSLEVKLERSISEGQHDNLQFSDVHRPPGAPAGAIGLRERRFRPGSRLQNWL